jgi:ABC-type multidrug transport system ATPase subunit
VPTVGLGDFALTLVDEHLRFTARVHGVKDAEHSAKALLEEMELVGKQDMLPAELSRGMILVAALLRPGPSGSH